jgi:hypothetical protein
MRRKLLRRERETQVAGIPPDGLKPRKVKKLIGRPRSQFDVVFEKLSLDELLQRREKTHRDELALSAGHRRR